MALNPTALRDALRYVTDPSFVGWAGYPGTPTAVGIAWGAAIRTYFNGIAAPPGITPAQHDAAQAAFAAIFQPVWYGDGLALLNSALAAYAAQMVPGAGVATPPPVSPAWSLVATLDGFAAATTIATVIDAWARTGTYTPPSGPVVPWS